MLAGLYYVRTVPECLTLPCARALQVTGPGAGPGPGPAFIVRSRTPNHIGHLLWVWCVCETYIAMSEETPKPDLQQQGEDKPAEQQQATEDKPEEQQQASDDTPAEQQQATGDKPEEQQPGSEAKPEEKPAADPQEKPTEQEATAATEQPHEVRNETECAAMQYTG